MLIIWELACYGTECFLVDYRETFDEEKEPEGMVVTGDMSSLVSTDLTLQAPSKVENGHTEEEEDDVVLVEPEPKATTAAGSKRKLEEEEIYSVEKRPRVGEIPVLVWRYIITNTA